MGLKKFSQKDPDEILQYTFDFSLVIPSVTELIVGTPLWEIIEQNDATETNITSMIVNGMTTQSGKLCSQYIQSGTSGINYVLSCEATTSSGEKVKLAGIIPCKTFK